MVRLPDIPLNSWLEDQQKRFREATDGLLPALDFQLEGMDQEAQIPPDFDAPGGRDQWLEAEQNLMADEYRRQQQEDEARRQQEIDAQAEQYRLQQQQAEQEEQAAAAQRETSVMDEIRGMGIPMPSDAFASFEASDPIRSGDPTSTTGVFDAVSPTPPVSEADQFNEFAGSMAKGMFGEPEEPAAPVPDNTSSTGLLDQLSSAAGSVRSAVDSVGTAISENPLYQTAVRGGMPDAVQIARRGEESAGQLVDQYGAGKIASDLGRAREIEQEAEAFQRPDQSMRERIMGTTLPPAYVEANPEKAAEYDEIQRSKQDLVMGASGTMGAGGMADDAIDAIKRLWNSGMEDAATNAAKELAQKSTMTLDDILGRVKGMVNPASAAAPLDEAPPVRTPEQRVMDDAMGEKGLDPEEARQQRLPGFEDLVDEPAPPRESIRGFGAVPEDMPRPAEDAVRILNDERNAGQKPFTFEERADEAARIINADPAEVRRILSAAQDIDPKRAGTEQEILKQNTRQLGDDWDVARQEFWRAREELAEYQRQNPSATPDQVPAEITSDLAYRATEFQRLTNDLSMAVKGQSLSAKAASQMLNAQRGGRLGAYAMTEAARAEDVAKSAGKAARAAQKAGRTGIVDKEAEDALREIGEKLNNRRSRRAVSGGSDVDREIDALGGKPTPTRREPKKPESETIAERYGRLLREEGRLKDTGAPEEEITRIGYELQELRQQAREEMTAAVRRRLEDRAMKAIDAPAPTVEELDRIVNETVGRRALSGMRGEITAKAKGFRTPEVLAQKELAGLEGAWQKELDRAFQRHVRDTEKLQKSIDLQVQRRIDGMLAQERRAEVKQQVKEMAQQAQVWAGRIRKMPDQPGLQEEYDLILRQMREHSNVGERVAADLEQRLGVNLSEDAVNRMFRESRQATEAISEARIRAVQQQIRDVLDNPRGPDRAARMQQLYQDLSEINVQGLQKASGIRQKAYTTGIMKSGLSAEGADQSKLVEMLMAVDPNDVSTLRPVLETMARPNLWQLWREISYINLLSSPLTHLTNVFSTSANIIGKVALKNGLETIGSGGQTSGYVAGIKGLAAGAKEGGRLFKTTMSTGINPKRLDDAVATGDFSHIGRELVPLQLARVKGGRALGTLMHQISTRPLEAADALMGQMVFMSEAARIAQQKADDLIKTNAPELRTMLGGDADVPERERVAQYIMENIWDFPDVVKGAGKIEDYTLFREKGQSGLEQAIRRFAGLKEIGPDANAAQKFGSLLVDFVLPFTNVPVNFAKQGLQATAHGIAAPLNIPRAIGKTLTGNAQEGGELFAKSAQGAALMTAGGIFAMGDNLTARGPEDPGDRRVWLQDHKVNSYRFPGTTQWISYEGMPWAIPFAVIAGAKETIEFAKERDPNLSDAEWYGEAAIGAASGAVEGAMSHTLVESAIRNAKTLLGQNEGWSATSQAVSGVVSRYTPTPLPSGMMNFLALMADVVERDAGKARNIGEVLPVAQNLLQMRVPLARNELPARLDAYGEETPNNRSPLVSGAAAAIPNYRGPGPGENDPITEQLQRGSIGLPDAPKEIRRSPTTVLPLTIAEQREFQRIYGERYRTLLENRGAGTRAMTEKRFEEIRTRAREYAQEQVRRSIPLEERRRRFVRKPEERIAP